MAVWKHDKYKGRDPHCSFCGKHEKEVRTFLRGPNVGICDECVELTMDICRHKSSNAFYLRSPAEYRKLAEQAQNGSREMLLKLALEAEIQTDKQQEE